MTITPKQARARLEQKPDANRIERRAYRTIAGMQWEYAPQAHLNGAWKYVTGVAWKVNGDYDIRTSRTATGAIWFSDPDEVREACEELDVATYRIVRRLVGEPEAID